MTQKIECPNCGFSWEENPPVVFPQLVPCPACGESFKVPPGKAPAKPGKK